MSTIPSFIDRSNLTINRTNTNNKDGRTVQVGAVDPEGDTLTLTKWTEDVGMAAVMPDEEFSVTYQKKGEEPVKVDFINDDHAYDLANALNNADQADNLDAYAVDGIIYDLESQAGMGGGAMSLGF